MNSTIRGKDFVLNADVIFKSDDYEFIDSDVIATCLDATEKYQYDKEGNKTDVQIGWNYEVRVPKRKLSIIISVENLKCAFDFDNDDVQKIKFTNFRATFYVNRNNFLELSCKADKAESVKATTSQTI